MSDATAWAIAVFVCLWIGWPLHNIADDLRRIRQQAEGRRR